MVMQLTTYHTLVTKVLMLSSGRNSRQNCISPFNGLTSAVELYQELKYCRKVSVPLLPGGSIPILFINIITAEILELNQHLEQTMGKDSISGFSWHETIMSLTRKTGKRERECFVFESWVSSMYPTIFLFCLSASQLQLAGLSCLWREVMLDSVLNSRGIIFQQDKCLLKLLLHRKCK